MYNIRKKLKIPEEKRNFIILNFRLYSVYIYIYSTYVSVAAVCDNNNIGHLMETSLYINT